MLDHQYNAVKPVSVECISGKILDWAVGYAIRESTDDQVFAGDDGDGNYHNTREAWLTDWSRNESPTTNASELEPLVNTYIRHITRNDTKSDQQWTAITTNDVLATGPTFAIAVCRAIVLDLIGNKIAVPVTLLIENRNESPNMYVIKT